MKNNKVLIFSIALNGYQWCYRSYLGSQKAYALKHGYEYCCVARPWFTRLGVECCWLKLTLMESAFASGYQTVVFVDADAKIQPDAPAIENIAKQSASLFMAKGYTGRFNSGVVVAKNCAVVRDWLQQVLASRASSVAPNNSVGWGENGHIIELAKGQDFIAELDVKWNNTYNLELNDFIRHFNHGPMRTTLVLRLFHKCLSRFTKLICKLPEMPSMKNSELDSLTQLTQKVQTCYEQFSPENGHFSD